MDPNDEGTMREEIMRAEAMAYRHPTIKACGFCHNCTESIGSGELFCSRDCRDDYQRVLDARRRDYGVI